MTSEEVVEANGVELCVGTFGERSDPAILLAHGAGDSMIAWREGLCERLAAGGRYVVRYDARDAGRSTTWPPGAPGYTSADVVADAAALVDWLGLGPVHFAGLSGGGADAQLLALDYPDRVATLTLLSTTPGDPTSQSPDLPAPLGDLFADRPDPDWSNRDAVVEYLVEAERPFAGSHGFDEDEQRAYAGRVFDRTVDLAAQTTNPFRVPGDGPWRKRLGDITAPTLVIHGTDDPLFPLEHGRALAREIPGAELLVLEGVGHEYPPPATWDVVVAAILRHTSV